jgi:hypothetical protein
MIRNEFANGDGQIAPAAVGISPTAAWLYNALSEDHGATNLTIDLAPPREHMFESLWDLQENVDLFVAANKESEQSIFPVNSPLPSYPIFALLTFYRSPSFHTRFPQAAHPSWNQLRQSFVPLACSIELLTLICLGATIVSPC